MKKYIPILGSIIGLSACLWGWSLTDWKIMSVFFLMLIANNMCFVDNEHQRKLARKNTETMEKMMDMAEVLSDTIKRASK